MLIYYFYNTYLLHGRITDWNNQNQNLLQLFRHAYSNQTHQSNSLNHLLICNQSLEITGGYCYKNKDKILKIIFFDSFLKKYSSLKIILIYIQEIFVIIKRPKSVKIS